MNAPITLQAAIDKVKKNVADSIRWAKEREAKDIERVENSFLFYQEINSLSDLDIFKAESYWSIAEPSFHLDKSDPEVWRTIHSVVGELENYGQTAIGDGRSRMVKVSLRPKDKRFNHIQFTYNKKLPKGGKCRIETITEKRTVMVCDSD